MPLSPDDITDLGRWSPICFATERLRDQALARYRVWQERQVVQP